MRINLTYDKKNYCLEYSRNAVRQMESQGFALSQIFDKPMTMIPLLVSGAFVKNHKGIKRSLIDEIYSNVTNKMGNETDNGFVQALIEMYAETLSTLTDDKPADEGNVALWTVTKD